jgi:putative ABC transport system ATP-binding protein
VRLDALGVRVEVEGRELFAPIDLSAEAGERVAVVGPSGSGKSSLLAVLAGLAVPAAGSVRLDGTAVAGSVPRGVGVVLQGYGLVSLLTAAENVAVGLRLSGLRPGDADDHTTTALGEFGLAEYAAHLVQELSGGQQQRVAVARAVAVATRLLIADEPTAEQDATNRRIVLDRILAVADQGAAVVIATHDPAVAERCDRVVQIG